MFNSRKTKDQELIISQLFEIFKFDKDIILSVCEAQDWQIDDCIESLVTYGENLTFLQKTKENDTSNNVNSYACAMKNNNKENIENLNENVNFNNLGAVPKSSNNIEQKLNELISGNSKIKVIADHIVSGHKILILMRGAPGSGKSYLARQLLKFIDVSEKYDCKSFICSTDDYFYDINDKYVHQAEKLSDAHEFNQRRVRKKAMEGWSPIIVDNTNIRIWEMLPYVQIAVQYGYVIEILEPNTPWRNSASKLALKNTHGVPKEKLKRILMNYEPVEKSQLLKMMKSTQYTVPLPQLRKYPPIEIVMDIDSPEKPPNQEQFIENHEPAIETTNSLNNNISWINSICPEPEKINIESDTTELLNENLTKSNFWESFNTNLNEIQSKVNFFNSKNDSWATNKEIFSSDFKKDKNLIIFDENKKNADNSSNSWLTYDDSNDKTNESDNKIDQPKQPRNTSEEKNIYQENQEEIPTASTITEEWQPYESESSEFWNIRTKETIKKLPKPQRNITKVDNLSNENIFKILKEQENKDETPKIEIPIKDNKLNVELKRHSVDCPKENESFILIRQVCLDKNVNGLWDLFEKCDGNAQWVFDIILNDDTSVESLTNFSDASDYKCNCNNETLNETLLEQHSKNNNNNNNNSTDSSKQKSKKDKSYISDELLKVKHVIENRIVIDDSQYSEHIKKIRSTKHCSESNMNNLSKISCLQDENGSDDLTEATNEDEMIEINLGKELIQQLENLFSVGPGACLKDLKTNIFMPKSLGKQLYALWMESIYNQLEEEKQETIRRDEEFAILLQSSCETNITKEESYKDILDMELAWSIYKTNPDQWKGAIPQNLASHLAHDKLCEMFPDIEKETLLQILQAHDNSFSQSVKALKSSMDENYSDILNQKKDKLLKLANDETEGKISEETLSNRNSFVKKSSPEESKKAALRNFEECRNLAAHHSQLKAECYEKAKEAIQKGNSTVAVYYSQISNLHKNKIDYYNHKAANCIMEVHDLTQNNPDFIDLHYLYTMEALECLDIFLDDHILKLRKMNRPYKHIFIITGRGLHSAKGVSTIKNKVKSRLKDRILKWSEVNPGLLKVKVFSGSKFSKNS